jgi:hypothetical protein
MAIDKIASGIMGFTDLPWSGQAESEELGWARRTTARIHPQADERATRGGRGRGMDLAVYHPQEMHLQVFP